MTATELVMQPRGECRLASCPLASGGTACEQGHDDVIDCPEFEPADSAELGTEMSANLPEDGTAPLDVRGRNAITPADQAVEVYLGDGLTIKEATAVLQAGPATIVLPVGNVHVGKSTLIASLWEQICAGNAGGWSFAGSLTPSAFEDRCFLATLASGRDRAEQARTPDGTDRVFLHVAVVRNCSADDPPVLRELLLADVSGEHASNFVGADEPGPVRPLLHVADVIAVLVDGDRLAVVTREVVDAGDGWLAAEGGVAAVMVVGV